MKFSILIICISFLMASCDKQGSYDYHFDWATVDTRLIETELLKIAKNQHPYSQEINIEADKLRANARRLSSQINSLEKIARDKCLPERIRNMPEGLRVAPSISHISTDSKSLSSKELIAIATSNNCIKEIESEPLISDLRVKLEKVNNISKQKSRHDSELRERVGVYTNILIAEYSKDKFEIVITNNKQNILFNKSGLSIDITEAIINDIKTNEPQI